MSSYGGRVCDRWSDNWSRSYGENLPHRTTPEEKEEAINVAGDNTAACVTCDETA